MEKGMNASEFCEQLATAMPTKAELEAHGLDEDDIESIQACFLAKKRNRVLQGNGSELKKLVYEYDCSSVEVGLVRFLEEPVDYAQGREFAKFEYDPLVVRRDGKVAMLDMLDRTWEYFICASSAGQFLDALAAYAMQVKRRGEWAGKSEQATNQYSLAAGGPEYAAFWRTLCSF